MSPPVRLRAVDADDLRVISAHLQDAIVPIGDICFLPRQKRFALVANRFCWEQAVDAPEQNDRIDDADAFEPRFKRVKSGFCVENTLSARRQNIDPHNRSRMLNLLHIAQDDHGLMMLFSENARIHLTLEENWSATLEDFDEPWPCGHRPCHADTSDRNRA